MSDADAAAARHERRCSALRPVAAGVALFVATRTVAACEVLGCLPATIERVKPAIVGIGVHDAHGRPMDILRASGFAVGNGNTVVTNHHALAPPAGANPDTGELAIYFVSGSKEEYRPARILARDPQHDLALLGFDGPPLAALTLGTSAETREGMSIAFTGYPLGAILGLHPATHVGIVAAISPLAIPVSQSDELTPATIKALKDPFRILQLDATGYPGNSGSPVYAVESGRVIGIVNKGFISDRKESALAQPSGITYAIPVDYLRQLLERTSTTTRP